MAVKQIQLLCISSIVSTPWQLVNRIVEQRNLAKLIMVDKGFSKNVGRKHLMVLTLHLTLNC
jgi:hypothetical protein